MKMKSVCWSKHVFDFTTYKIQHDLQTQNLIQNMLLLILKND